MDIFFPLFPPVCVGSGGFIILDTLGFISVRALKLAIIFACIFACILFPFIIDAAFAIIELPPRIIGGLATWIAFPNKGLFV